MAKKIDLSRAKDFLFRYGERVGLFTCIGLALLLIVWGLVGASGPGTPNGDPWDKVLTAQANGLRQTMPAAGDVDGPKILAGIKFPELDWRDVASRVNPGPYISLSENADFRRRNPEILPVMGGDENFQFDYMDRGFIRHEVLKGQVLTVAETADAAGPQRPIAGIGRPMAPNMAAGQNTGGGPTLAQVLQPRGVLVVTGIFPMKKQVDEYIKALRYAGLGELQAAKELPRMVGFNVVREERGPDGKVTTTKEMQQVIYYDYQKKALFIDPGLRKELGEAIYDETNPKSLAPVIHEGLVTPLPLLPEGLKYPKLKIKGDYWPKEDQLAEADANAGPDDAPMKSNMPAAGNPAMRPQIPGAKGAGILPMQKGNANVPGEGNAPNQSPEAKTEFIPLKKLEKTNPEIFERLSGDYNIFHPFGTFPEKAGAGNDGAPMGIPGAAGQAGGVEFGFGAQADGGGAGPAGAIPPGGKGPTGPVMAPPGKFKTTMPKGPAMAPPGKGDEAPAGNLKIYDAIVRFLDVDVKPNHTYKYAIQVRAANPNFGKKNDVVQQAWADVKELASLQWTWTKSFTIPGTYHLFAVDQLYVDGLGDPKNFRMKVAESKKADADHAIFQLHRWFSVGGERGDFLIGDWAIAERLVVRKGEQIGQSDMIVEIPTWNKGLGAFEMRTTVPPAIKGRPAPRPHPGVPLDFIPVTTSADGKRTDSVPPMLVDFSGGKKTFKGGLMDEAAVDALILTPDGRLIVHNSRADISAVITSGSVEPTSRQERVEAWRKRNQAAISGGAASGPAAGPGGGGAILGQPR